MKMKKFILNKNNNSKKLIIGVSMLFCAVILIVGGTIAYFTQSDTKEIDNLLTVDIRDTLEYTDNKDYMRQRLIPAKEEIAKQAYALEGNNKCIDSYGYSACSVYRFNIKNIANVSQELIIDLAPTVNNFGNLYYMLYEIDKDGNTVNNPIPNKLDTLTEEMIQNNNIPSYNLAKEVIVNPNSDITYEVVFFVNDIGSDQTLEDSGKTFGGTVKISSVTTGKYMVESFGEDCWKTELLSDGTYSLTEFYGIDNTFRIEYNDEEEDEAELIYGENFGVINNSCAGYINDDDKDGYYSVYVPSTIGGKEISTLGNELFSTRIVYLDSNGDYLEEKYQLNYEKINYLKIEEGITKIEDGCADYCNRDGITKESGTFSGLGNDWLNEDMIENFELIVSLPSTLTYIGRAAFAFSQIYSLTIPASVEEIGAEIIYIVSFENLVFEDTLTNPSQLKIINKNAFSSSSITSLTLPNSVTTIGDYAFGNCRLDYQNEDNPLYLPNSITTMGELVFAANDNLKYIYFEGDTSGFGSSWNGGATLLPRRN